MSKNESIQNLCTALEELGNAIEKGSSENRTLNESLGWNAPALDRFDLAKIATNLSIRLLDSSKSRTLTKDDEEYIDSITRQVGLLKTNIVTHFYNGNGQQASLTYLNSMFGIEALLMGYIFPTWEQLDDPSLMPKTLARRIRSVGSQLATIEPNIEKLKEDIKSIKAARDAAESLPTDLESLQEARKEIGDLKNKASKDQEAISGTKDKSDGLLEKINSALAEATTLVNQLKDLHRIGTSTTLAGAFEEKTKLLNWTILGWLVILILALSVEMFLGGNRVESITLAMQNSSINQDIVWINVVLSLFSVIPPIWLAWVATKQIIQRFRLAEDYAYKATISNAYEGYRREAVALNPAFMNKLFDSALNRLDELPGRLVDTETHGSPLHELLASKDVRIAFKKVPEFSEKVSDLAKDSLQKIAKNKPKTEP